MPDQWSCEFEELLVRTAVPTVVPLDVPTLVHRGDRRRSVRLASSVAAGVLVLAGLVANLPGAVGSGPPVIGELPAEEVRPEVPGGPEPRPFPTIIGAPGAAGAAGPSAVGAGRTSVGLAAPDGPGRRPLGEGAAVPGPARDLQDADEAGEDEAEVQRWEFWGGPGGWEDVSARHRTLCTMPEVCSYPFVPFEAGFTWAGESWASHARPRPPQGQPTDRVTLWSPEVQGTSGRIRVGYTWARDPGVTQVRVLLYGTSSETSVGDARVAMSSGDEVTFSPRRLREEGVLEASLELEPHFTDLSVAIGLTQDWSEDEAWRPSGFEVLWVEWIPVE